MRCPRCAYKGKLFQGMCAVCGYPLEQETSDSSTAAVQQPFLYASDQYSPLTNHYAPVTLDPQLTGTRQSISGLEAGDTLRSGRYRLQERITLPTSQQQHGQAWNAYDLRMASRFVVIREVKFSSEMAATPAQKEYLANKIAQRLNRMGEHPGLSRVSDMFSENESYFLVFLYPQGETLASLLKNWSNGLPEYMIAEYAWQLCDVLTSLGEQQIVHGAISPETILIDEEGRQAILMHLPLLPLKESVGKIDDIGSSYRAPEQVHGIITPASDLYSLAATLYHAVTGSSPHERPPAFYPPARRLNEVVSPAMELILARQLRLTVTQRYNSPHEMKQDLAALLESYATQATRVIVPLQSSEMPLLLLKDEKGIKIDLRNMKIIIPVLVSILMILGLLLVIILHAIAL